ncbi:unnamed protein product [Fraxinus pennsylvanica]|uniref:Wbp11/ELF5/Saf1 N-terminal domain-containing protein n=1 Tax=Fraxinus pennsylvanica TaxID=56036 RepID=A0AAD2EFA4_9LAMI|nr:unnamed protein product [Fraxinus pennsylvanica]
MVKTTKGGKTMNPTDAYRKEIRKKELKRNKKERKKVREVGILKKDPDTLKDQIQKLEAMKADGALDKARKHKKRQLEDTLNLVIKKRKEYEDKLKEKGEAPVMFSHLGPVQRRATAEEEERVRHPRPEDSVYYHPTLNPSGAPPPGKPPMFKSSIGPRIPLTEASSSNAASSSISESEEAGLSVPPPPPPPMPSAGLDAGDDTIMPASLPLPPPPPMPPKPAMTDFTTPLPPLPPPPPGPPPKELIATRPPLPPPPALPQSVQPPPPGTVGNEKERSHSAKSDEPASRDSTHASTMLPPPPPPGLPPKLGNDQSEGSSSESDLKTSSENNDLSKMVPPPPIRQQPPVPGPAMVTMPPGILRFPPPPPEMRPPLPPPGIPGQLAPPGVMIPPVQLPPFGPPPMMIPLPPGPPPIPQGELVFRQPAPPKPSYVKSAASTVVKRPLAQHTPELTAMVPASVRVRRESVLPKPKAKPTTAVPTNRPPAAAPVMRQESSSSSSAPKPQSIDDSYMAFLEDMKALGALDE